MEWCFQFFKDLPEVFPLHATTKLKIPTSLQLFDSPLGSVLVPFCDTNPVLHSEGESFLNNGINMDSIHFSGFRPSSVHVKSAPNSPIIFSVAIISVSV